MALPPDIKRGDPITADFLNAVKNSVLSSIYVGPNMTMTRTGGRVGLDAVGSGGRGASIVGSAFWARITDSTSYSHAWVEVQKGSDLHFTIVTGGRSGTTGVNAATEVNARQGVPAGTYVLMHVATVAGELRYFFDLGAGTSMLDADNSTTYEDMGPEPSAEAESASSNTWDISSQTFRGVRFPIITRVAYNEAGDETLYGFYRMLIFDANGHLTFVSAETRYTIDAPEACS